MLAADIELAISSTQVTGAIGTLILMLLALIGWFVRAEWRGVNVRLGTIETNTTDLPYLKDCVRRMESDMVVLRSRQHKIANFVNAMQGKFSAEELGVLDLEKSEP